MVKVGLEDGSTIVRLGRKDWVKLVCVLIACLWGHAQMQCSRIDRLGMNVQALDLRMKATEKSVAEVRNDYRDLNVFIRTRAQTDDHNQVGVAK